MSSPLDSTAGDAGVGRTNGTPVENGAASRVKTPEGPNALEGTHQAFHREGDAVHFSDIDARVKNVMVTHLNRMYQMAVDLRRDKPAVFKNNPIYQSLIDVMERNPDFFTLEDIPQGEEMYKKGLKGVLGQKETIAPEIPRVTIEDFSDQDLFVLDGVLRVATDELALSAGVNVINPNQRIILTEPGIATNKNYQLLKNGKPAPVGASLPLLQRQFASVGGRLNTPYAQEIGFSTDQYDQRERLQEIGELVNTRIALTEALTGKKAWDSLGQRNPEFARDRLSMRTRLVEEQLLFERHPGRQINQLTGLERIRLHRDALQQSIVDIGSDRYEDITERVKGKYETPELAAQAVQQAEGFEEQQVNIPVYKEVQTQPNGSTQEVTITKQEWEQGKQALDAKDEEITNKQTEIDNIVAKIQAAEQEVTRLETLDITQNPPDIAPNLIQAVTQEQQHVTTVEATITRLEAELAKLETNEVTIRADHAAAAQALQNFVVDFSDTAQRDAYIDTLKRQITVQRQGQPQVITELSDAAVRHIQELTTTYNQLQKTLAENEYRITRIDDIRNAGGELDVARGALTTAQTNLEGAQVAARTAQEAERRRQLSQARTRLSRAQSNKTARENEKGTLQTERDGLHQVKVPPDTETSTPPEAKQIRFIIGTDGEKYRENINNICEVMFSEESEQALESFDTLRATLFGVGDNLEGQEMAQEVCPDEVLIDNLASAMNVTPDNWIVWLGLTNPPYAFLNSDGTIDWNNWQLQRGIEITKADLINNARDGLIARMRHNSTSTNALIAMSILRERLKAASTGRPTEYTGQTKKVTIT